MRWILETPIALYRKQTAALWRCTIAARIAGHPLRWAKCRVMTSSVRTTDCSSHRLVSASRFLPRPTHHQPSEYARFRPRKCTGSCGSGPATRRKPIQSSIPSDLAYLSSPDWHTVWGYQAVNANFMQLKENVLDLTHFAFLHKKSLGVTDWDRPPARRSDCYRGSRPARSSTWLRCPPFTVPAGKPVGKPVNRDNWGALLSPGAHHGAVDMHRSQFEPEDSSGSRCALSISDAGLDREDPLLLGVRPRSWRSTFDAGATRATADVVFGEDITVVEAVAGNGASFDRS